MVDVIKPRSTSYKFCLLSSGGKQVNRAGRCSQVSDAYRQVQTSFCDQHSDYQVRHFHYHLFNIQVGQ